MSARWGALTRGLAILSTLVVGSGGCGILIGDGDSPLYDEPWPDERLRRDDGTIDLSDFPRGTQVPLRDQLLEDLRDARGFGVASPIYFRLDDELDPSSLPTLAQSVDAASSVWLVNVDRTSDRLGRRAPTEVRFTSASAAFAPARLLSVLPVPGAPLRSNTLYAAVVTTRVRTAYGDPLRPRHPVAEPSSEVHRAALAVLEQLGLGASEIAELAVFRTGPDPATELRADVERSLRLHLPVLERAPELVEEHADYCVYETAVRMPQYQRGRPPYLFEGGGWARDETGELQLQRRELARLLLTVPRRTAVGRYPTAVLVRSGAGGDRPLVDRGVEDRDGNSPAGTGLAAHFARAGFLGVSVDGPLGGLRNVAGWDEQFATFNVLNMPALRDNIRQSALELALLAHVLEHVAVDASACAGANPRARPSGSHLALVGHSMGATIAPLVVAVEPRYGAMILSGAGASWIRQVLYKRSPLPTRELGELMLGYTIHDRELAAHDPLLGLLQWGGEAADPQIYGHAMAAREDPPHVLVFQGLLDTYIPPPVANPLNLAMGLDLGGASLDEGFPEFRPYIEDEALGLQRALDYPVTRNGPRENTLVLSQRPEDGIEDGHEVLFQRPGAQRQLRCFLESYATGAPVVVEPGDPLEACPPS